jgi:quinoprotein dehydrogenase-associated probable ABC transporter substrate-binding protein
MFACAHRAHDEGAGAAQSAQAQPKYPTFERPVEPQMPPALTEQHTLRVCADPNNLPFSNERGEGFENKLAELIAHDLGARLEYVWWAERRGFVRNTLKAGACDLIMGLPNGSELALTTNPYYRSTYVFVYRKDRNLALASFDDPRLRELKIGVQMIGNDFTNTPPAHALANRHIIEHVQGFMIYGNYAAANPQAPIIDAVARGQIDTAVVWGPLAGYVAKRSRVPLAVVPVAPQIDQPFLPFVYDISLAVRRGEQEFHDKLDEILDRRKDDIDRLLDDYGVPQVKG